MAQNRGAVTGILQVVATVCSILGIVFYFVSDARVTIACAIVCFISSFVNVFWGEQNSLITEFIATGIGMFVAHLCDLDMLSTASLALCIENISMMVIGWTAFLTFYVTTSRGNRPEKDIEAPDPIKEKEKAVKEAKRELSEAKREQKQAKAHNPDKAKFKTILLVCLLLTVVFCVAEMNYFESRLEIETAKAYEEGHLNGFAEGQSNEYSIVKPKFDKLNEKLNNIKPEYEFYHEHAVVCDTDKYYYHHFECSNFEGESFYIFNSEYAKSLGYLPCDDCIK